MTESWPESELKASLEQGFAASVGYSGVRELIPDTNNRAAVDVPVLDATWADNSAGMTWHENAEQLLSNATRMMTSFLDEASAHGMVPNLKSGKSALVLLLRGKGSRGVAPKTFKGNCRTIHVPSRLHDGYVIHVEASYVHLGLGGSLCRNACMSGEAGRRLAIANSSCDRHRKVILQNRLVPLESLETRSLLFRALIRATFFNLEVWVADGAEWEQLRKGYVRMVRRLLVTVQNACTV